MKIQIFYFFYIFILCFLVPIKLHANDLCAFLSRCVCMNALNLERIRARHTKICIEVPVNLNQIKLTAKVVYS